MSSILNNIISRVRVHGPGNAAAYVFNGLRWLVSRRLGRERVERSVHGYRMLLNPQDPGISRNLWLNGDREQQLRHLLEQELEPGNVVLDLGANIGYYALLERQLIGDEGHIYALEPSPSNFELLKANIALNGAEQAIEVFPLAGGSAPSTGRFYLSEHSNLNTFIPRLNNGARAHGITDDYIEVEIVDMTSFLADKRPIDLLRMDVEGFEVEVIAGLRPAIESGNFRGKIVFECHFPKYDDETHSMREQLQMLFRNGYRPKVMTSNDEAKTHFGERGYEPTEVVRTGLNLFQGLYHGVSPEDAEHFVCDVGGVRDVLLAPGA